MAHSQETAAWKLELPLCAALGCPTSPRAVPSHTRSPPTDTAHLQKHTPRPRAHAPFVEPLEDRTGHTGRQLTRTASTKLTQTFHTGTHCLQTCQTFHRDTLESHIVTPHRYTRPPKFTLTLTLRRQHAGQTYTPSIRAGHTPVTNVPHALAADAFPTPRTRQRLKIPRLPDPVHIPRHMCTCLWELGCDLAWLVTPIFSKADPTRVEWLISWGVKGKKGKDTA